MRYYIYIETGQTLKQNRKNVSQTGPTDNLPSSSGAPGLAFSSNTKRRGSQSGEWERKRKQDTDVKHTTHNHTDKDERMRKGLYGTVTEMLMTDCDVSGQDLWDRFLPTAVPACLPCQSQAERD